MIRRTIIGLVAACCALAVTVAALQHPFAAAFFEYGQPREYEGVLVEDPYPMLFARPSGTPYLLVPEYKHGAAAAVRGLGGSAVRLRGVEARRGSHRLLELVPGSLQAMGRARETESEVGSERVRLVGEIVDSKCWYGVMNPGSGKVHRDCAVRCISGGLPPSFAVRVADGQVRAMLLTDSDGRPAGTRILEFVAEPVALKGVVVRVGGVAMLQADLGSIRRLSR